MIWRQSRPLRKIEGQGLQIAESEGVVVGGFGLASLRELALWRKLVSTGLGEHPLRTLVIAPEWTPRDRRTVQASFPPSEWSQIELHDDPNETIRRTLEINSEQTFALLIQEGKITRGVVGGPTDAGWDYLADVPDSPH